MDGTTTTDAKLKKTEDNMKFTHHQSQSLRVNYNDEPIEEVDSCKYLGFT